jgi:N-acetylglucosamine kinase-like BadF-type ATPase
MSNKDDIYVIGVDGDGSKTLAAVSDSQGRLLGEGIAAGCNYVRTGIGQAIANIKLAVDEALQQAGLAAAHIAFIQYALAGADRKEDFDILLPALAALPFDKFDLVCDTIAGLRSGSPSNTGVVLICGFGTNAAGRNRLGRMVQIGGYGSFYGDYAGGNRLAQLTFQAAIRSWEGRERESILTEKIARYHGLPDIEAVIQHYLNTGIGRVPHELAIVVHEAANEGDRLSISLLENLGKELGVTAVAVIGKMDDFIGEDENIRIVGIGSVLQKGRSPHLLKALEQTVREKHPHVHICIPQVEPVMGSVLLALDQLGIG